MKKKFTFGEKHLSITKQLTIMNDTEKSLKSHGNYFLALQTDFEILSRYVEINTSNYKTYSTELAKILMTATQEIDVLLKSICCIIDSSRKPDNLKIKDYFKIISKSCYRDILTEKFYIPRFSLEFTPYSNWNEECSPNWWTANNKVKHDRASSFERANLENVINSLGALLVTNLYYYKVIREKEKLPQSIKKIINDIGFSDKYSSLFQLSEDYYFKVPVL